MVRTTTNCIGVWVSQVLYWVSWLCHPSREGLTVAMFEQMPASDSSVNAVSVIPVHIRTKDKTSSSKEACCHVSMDFCLLCDLLLHTNNLYTLLIRTTLISEKQWSFLYSNQFVPVKMQVIILIFLQHKQTGC